MPEAAPRWRKVGRDLWLHKSRTLLVVLAIVVGIVGAGAVLDTWSLLRQVTRDQFRASNPASATLRTERVDAGLLARVRALPAVRAAQGRRTTVASAQVEGTWRTAILFTVDDFTAVTIGALEPTQGAWPPLDGGLVVETSSVEFAHTGVGSPLTVQVGDGAPRELPVVGIARDVGLAPGWMEHVVYGFATRATIARLGVPPALDELQIVVSGDRLDRAAVRRVAYDVKRLVEASGRRVTNVDVPVPGRHVHAAQIESLLFTQLAFGALALLLSSLLVVNLVTAMLAGQVREIGVMKAVGGRFGQLVAMYLGLAAALGILACAVGVRAAAAIGRAYAQFTADTLNFSLAGARLPVSIVLLQLAVGVLLPVAAAAVPVMRGCRIPVAVALRDFGISAPAAAGRGRLLLRAGGIARPLLLSLRNAFRRRQRMALTLVTLAVGGAVYLGALNLRAAVVSSVDLLFAPQRFDLALRLAGRYPAAAVASAARGVDGVATFESWRGARAALSHGGGVLGNTFPLVAVPVPSRLLAMKPLAGRWLRADDGRALVVNRRLLADEPELALGREVPLLVDGRETRWRVVGVVESGPSANAYAPRHAFALGGESDEADVVVVAAAAGGPASRRDLLQRLRTAFGDAGIAVQSGNLKTQQRKVVEDHLLMVAGFLGIMGQLMIVVGGLGLASTMSLAVLERRREIGILRTIGARHRAILALITVESMVIALLSWLLAVPLSVPMSVVLGEAFGRIMFRVPVILLPTGAGVLRWLVVVLAVSLLASAWPAWRALRVSTAAALAYE